MENNNRTILAIALIILLWSGYSLFFPPQRPPAEETSEKAVAEKPVTDQAKEPAPISLEKQETIPVAAVPGDYKEKIINVSTGLYDMELSTTGATIRSVLLKKYRESNKPDAKPYELKPFGPEFLGSFKTSGADGLFIPANLPFTLSTQGDLSFDSGSQSVSFTATTSTGLSLVKTYTFHADSYRIDVSVDVINQSGQPQQGVVNLSLTTAWDESMKGDRYGHVGPVSFDGKELIEEDPEDLAKAAKIYGEGIVWSGFTNKYFVTLVYPDEAAQQVQIERREGYIANKFISPFFTLQPGQRQQLNYVSFIGPKDYDRLQAIGYHFEEAKDYGFFSVLAKPLMHVLKFFYGFLGNYGFAIILLTVCIKIIFWPLTQKSYKSMKGMQKLQPEMQKLREKFGHDKQRLNQEMMAFYKNNKVNPLGGCLPMVIQIPVFFALYQVLLGAIELRHAPFIFWLTDLSAKDPYYITPLIMGATMFIQQRMTPTNMDPNQAKIMMAMPVVFTFLFLNFPSGLVVYWLVNNLLTILQQYLIKRQPE